MAFNLMGLFLTILACYNLPPAEAYDQKNNQNNLYRYYHENSPHTKDQKLAKRNELKRYKWMAESNLPTQNSAHNNISSGQSPVIISSLDSHVERSEDLTSQDKLLNAVALIRQVLRSGHSSKEIKGLNKTELKLARNVLPVTDKEKLVAKADVRIEPDANQIKDESENTKHDDYQKVSRSEEVNTEKQDKLKREFWEKNKENYLKNLSPGKYEIESLTSEELNNFDGMIGDDSDDLIKREDNIPNIESSTSLPDSGNIDSIPSTLQSFTEQAKSFIRRHLWLKHKAKVGLNNINKEKRFLIRKKRIGELVDNTEHFLTENKGVKRDCDPEATKRDVNGCGQNIIK